MHMWPVYCSSQWHWYSKPYFTRSIHILKLHPTQTEHVTYVQLTFSKNVIILHYVLQSPKNAKKVYFVTWWNWTDVIVLSFIHVLNSTTNQLNVGGQCGILFVTLMLIIMVNKDEWILDNVWFIKFRSKHSST